MDYYLTFVWVSIFQANFKIKVPVGLFYKFGFKKFEQGIDEVTMNSVLAGARIKLHINSKIWISINSRNRADKYNRAINPVETQFDKVFSKKVSSYNIKVRIGLTIFN